MAGRKEKNSRLFLFMAAVLGSIVVVLNVAQINIISAIAKNKIEETTIIEAKEISAQASVSVKHLLESYFNALDYYTKSDVAQTLDDGKILDFIKEKSSTRPDFFGYIGYVNSKGHNYTDKGGESDVKDREYFQAIMGGGAETYINNPVIAKTTGLRTVHICRSLKVNDRARGLFFGAANPDLISESLREMDLGDLGFCVIFGSDGELVGASDDIEKVKADFEAMKSNYPDSYKTIVKMYESMENKIQRGVNGKGRKALLLSNKIEYTPWTLVLVLYEDSIFSAENAIFHTMIIGAVVLIIMLLLVTAVVLFVSIKPLSVVESTIRGIATGDADLTKRIAVKSNNEIGRIVEGFNLFAEKLQSIISAMKDSKAELVDAGELLNDSTTDTMAAISQIIAQIETMGNNVDAQTDSVHQTAGAVNQIAGNIESLNRMIEMQSSSVTQASAAVEEMIGNINSVSSSVEKMSGSFAALEQKVVVGVQRQNDVNVKIGDIERESQALKEANSVILGIAEQTNLLAMNAAIEAAHAGEAGKGFSVVADEIRKLSEDSSAQSQTIGKQLSNITSAIESIVSTSQLASDAFEDVSAGISGTSDLVREISCAMQEQNEGSKQISVALENMNDTSREVKTASFEMSEGNKAILDEIKNLQDATFSIRDGMTDMSNGARKINETGSVLSELSERMKSSIQRIGDEVDKFNV